MGKIDSFDVYVYIQKGMADWEIGHVTSELYSKRFFRDGAPEIHVWTVGDTTEPRRSMGGLNIVPDTTVQNIETGEGTVLILPGSASWPELRDDPVMDVAEEILSSNGTVCAICGSTVALADRGLLDSRRHTSNGPGFLEHFSPNYRGSRMYEDVPAVSDGGIITAGSPGGLLWSKLILQHLSVFSPETLDAWYSYFDTCNPQYYYAIESSLNHGNRLPAHPQCSRNTV